MSNRNRRANRSVPHKSASRFEMDALEGRVLLSGTAGQIFVTDGINTVGEYTTSGATVNASLISGLNNPQGMAVSGSDLFVTNIGADTIGEYTTTGATVNAALVSGLNIPVGIAVYGSDLFVTNTGAGTVGEYTTTGATVNAALLSGLGEPESIAISGSELFVANGESGGYTTIGEYTTAGATVNADLIPLGNNPSIAVSGSDLFVADYNYSDVGAISEYTLGATPGTITSSISLVPDLNQPTAIAVSGSDLFVAIYNYAADGGFNAIGEYTTAGATVNASLVSESSIEPSEGICVATQVVGPASQLSFGPPPDGATAGSPIPAVNVDVEDADGNLLTTDDSDVTLSIASGPSSVLNGTLTAAAVGGVATFTGMSINTAGTYTLAATDATDGLPVVTSNPFVVTPAYSGSGIAPNSVAGDTLVIAGTQAQPSAFDRLVFASSGDTYTLEDFLHSSAGTVETGSYSYTITSASAATIAITTDNASLELTFATGSSGTCYFTNPTDGDGGNGNALFTLSTPPVQNLAPNSVGGETAVLNIAGGGGTEYNTSGSETAALDSDGTFNATVGGSPESSGTYTYTQAIGSSDGIAEVVADDPTAPLSYTYLVFTSAAGGSFYRTDETSSNDLNDFDYGTFTIGPTTIGGSSGAVSASIAKSSLGSIFVPGSKATATIDLSNSGSTKADGTVQVQLYLTPDGAPADGTLLTTPSLDHVSVNLPAGKTHAVSASFFVPLTVGLGSEELVAVLSSVSGFANTTVSTSPAVQSGSETAALDFGLVATTRNVHLNDVINGSKVTFALAGPGTGTLTPDGSGGYSLSLSGTTTASNITINGAATLDSITTDGSIGNLSARNVSVDGDITVNDSAKSVKLGNFSDGTLSTTGATPTAITLGAVMDASLDCDDPLTKLSVASWGDSGVIDDISAPSIQNLTSAGDFSADVTADSFSSITIKGNLQGDILAGTAFGPSGLGSGDTFAAGTIGSVHINGDVTSSIIAAGLDATDDVFPLDGSDSLLAGSSIKSVFVGGTLSSDSFIVSASLPKKATVDHASITTAGNANFGLPA